MYTSILFVSIVGYFCTSVLFFLCESAHKDQNDGMNSSNIYQDL